jgi:hypothetical protein
VTGVDDSGDTVQAELSSSGWSVSHIQSGLAIATLLGQRAAVVLARELDASFPEYHKTNPHFSKERAEEVAEFVNRVKYPWKVSKQALTMNPRKAFEQAINKQAGFPENQLLDFPSGKWGFVGNVDARLGHVYKDGRELGDPLSDEDEAEMQKAKSFGVGFTDLKTRVFHSPYDAMAAAKKLGLGITISDWQLEKHPEIMDGLKRSRVKHKISATRKATMNPRKVVERFIQASISLDDPLYSTPVKIRGYSGAITVTSAHGKDAGDVLIKLRPDMTRAEHAQLARKFEPMAKSLQKEWEDTLNDAAMETWGRSWQVFDYKISGIGSDEFSDKYKNKLRYLAQASTKAKSIALAHTYASKSRRIR